MMRLAFVVLIVAPLAAQDKPVKPKFLYGHDVKVRDVGKPNFDPTTPRVGVEVFHDEKADALIAISETGQLAVTPFKKAGDDKKADWLTAFELRVRPGTEDSFAKSTKYASEVFKDLASGKHLFVTSQRTLAWADAPAGGSDKEPTWHHALVLKVRPANDTDFAGSGKMGVEVYKDQGTGKLLYLTEKGGLATGDAPTKAPDAQAVKAPKHLHGLNPFARKADEQNFVEKTTKSYGVEAFLDPNSNNIVYVSDVGGIAVIATADVKPNEKLKWSHSFTLKARKGGEKDFDKASKFGVEVFEDKHTGAMLYVCENGSIAAFKK